MTTKVLRIANAPLMANVKREENDCDADRPKRKRQRLDHLSQEEKLMRRKLKNRVAAQSARDRKKTKMQDLEEYVNMINKEKNQILRENDALRLKNENLMKENIELKKRLGQISDDVSNTAIVNAISSHLNGSIESAELINVPLPKAQEPLTMKELQKLAPHSTMPFVYLLMIMNLMQLLSCYKSVLNNCFMNPLMIMESKEATNTMKTIQWWGPQQNNWNPSKT